jgi:hypothetical protein
MKISEDVRKLAANPRFIPGVCNFDEPGVVPAGA